MTATPEQLQLMLFDGAIRFAEQGRAGLEAKQYDVSYDRLSRAQQIVSELSVTLREEHDADTCKRLKSLYTFIYLRLVDANVEHEVKAVDEALQVLRYQRETWLMLMKQRADDVASGNGESVLRVEARPAQRLSLAG